jgi:hypothetical protein
LAVRTRITALLVLLAAGGCTRAAADPPTPPAPVATQWPASVAGGACQLLDYDAIADALGVRFDVAAASRQGQTYTCVVQNSKASRPDLMLAVTETPADPAIFRSTMVPKGAQAQTGLGKAAYRARVAGDGVEVGWLSGDKRLITLRYTAAPGGKAVAIEALVALAKEVDKSSV